MGGPVPRVLVVDDDHAVRNAIRVNLTKQGYDVALCTRAEDALRAIEERPIDLLLTDVAMPGMTGMELLRVAKQRWPEVRVVVMTGYGSVQDAVAAMKCGADDYIIKPVSKDELMVIVERAMKEKALLAELVQLRQQIKEKYGFESLVGTTAPMIEIYEHITAVADTNALVLVQGPTGTGKELIAHAIHYRSARARGPFVQVNCAALPENLLESELFGHEKGSFTGAVRQHRGKFEQADGGTLMLDEVGEMTLTTQVKLLRALESGEVVRIGGSEVLRPDVRVIAATNRDLHAEVRAGRFREDLYYRLNVFTVSVPPLCERRDDVPLLVDHFVRRFCKENDRPDLRIAASTMRRLIDYHWPGNVRELKHVLERAVILSRGEELTAIKLPEAPQGKAPVREGLPAGMTLQAALLEYERRVLIEALKAARGVQAEAARNLGISRSNLNYRISRLGISVKDVVYE